MASPPPVRFARTSDGVRVAHRTDGDGPPLLIARGWITHVDSPMTNPAFAAWIDRLAQRFAVTRYDNRGNGLSDRHLDQPPTWDDLVLDLEAAADAVAPDDEIVLWGSSFGGPIAIQYAARHPDRVRALVLDGTFACGADLSSAEWRDAFLTLLGLARTLPHAVFAALSYLTDPDPGMTHGHRIRWLRQAIEPDLLEPLYRLLYEADVRDEAASLVVPTLVLHRAGSRAVPAAAAPQLAKLITGSRLVVLPGRAQNLWEEDPEPALAAVGEFLGVDLAPPPAPVDAGRLRAVLFTDIVGSTAFTSARGDDAAQALVRTHNDVVRRALAEVGGAEVKHTGDGIMAWVSSTSGAVRAAVAMQQALENAEFEVRIGISAGEPIDEDGDLFGSVVQLASRACAAAAPGEVLVTGVVREMASAKGFRFASAGTFDLRGFDAPVELWRIEHR
jgi:class 3 adenylate cyclase